MPEGPVALPDGKLALVEMGHASKSLTIVSPERFTRPSVSPR